MSEPVGNEVRLPCSGINVEEDVSRTSVDDETGLLFGSLKDSNSVPD